MNHKNERILKLVQRGITEPERIAKKTGLTIERVNLGLEWLRSTSELPALPKPDAPPA